MACVAFIRYANVHDRTMEQIERAFIVITDSCDAYLIALLLFQTVLYARLACGLVLSSDFGCTNKYLRNLGNT